MNEEQIEELRGMLPRVEVASGLSACWKCNYKIDKREGCLAFPDTKWRSKKFAHLKCVGIKVDEESEIYG